MSFGALASVGMRLRLVQLKDFKRFDDLTIDLGPNPAKVIALVGPNGSGKSSVFDAFEEKNKDIKGAHQGTEQPNFFGKRFFDSDPATKKQVYDRGTSIKLVRSDGIESWDHRSFYIRSSYRYTASLRLEAIQQQEPILDDRQRPRSSIAVDTRLPQNYARLQGLFWDAFADGKKTGDEIRKEVLDRINASLAKILEIRISSLGNVTRGQGQLFFEKEGSKDFPFENLSAGEKEVVDLTMDLFVKTREYNDTVFCIDEPELHLNTAIQRRLLTELVRFIPDNCQLWAATHSIGFLRALQDDLAADSQVIDFSSSDLFRGAHVVKPMARTRNNWLRLFRTALEDITGLLAPSRIIYCEGRPEPKSSGEERGLDALVYNKIFSEAYHDTLFVSGGGDDVTQNAALAIKVIGKAFQGVQLFLLKDRDGASDADRESFVKQNAVHRMLLRREVENYLYDAEIVGKCAAAADIAFDKSKYDGVISDICRQDLKLAPVPETIQSLCGSKLAADKLKLHLASFVTADTAVFAELEACALERP